MLLPRSAQRNGVNGAEEPRSSVRGGLLAGMAVAVSEEVQINTQLLAAITLATARTATARSRSMMWGTTAVLWIIPGGGRPPAITSNSSLRFKALVCESQCFVREANGGERSSVSLRDVARAARVSKWFLRYYSQHRGDFMPASSDQDTEQIQVTEELRPTSGPR